MLKGLGALCILLGGLLLRRYQMEHLRQEVDTLSDLLAALCRMAEEIRMTRTPLPRLLDHVGQGREQGVSAFFSTVSTAARQGGDVGETWRQAAEALPLGQESRVALLELGGGLQGDEESICKAISLACMDLSRKLEELRLHRPETEKRTTALCLSATALLVILLI
ncbi:MAG: stage III sporulation protein AB [Oscillibacter sp.]